MSAVRGTPSSVKAACAALSRWCVSTGFLHCAATHARTYRMPRGVARTTTLVGTWYVRRTATPSATVVPYTSTLQSRSCVAARTSSMRNPTDMAAQPRQRTKQIRATSFRDTMDTTRVFGVNKPRLRNHQRSHYQLTPNTLWCQLEWCIFPGELTLHAPASIRRHRGMDVCHTSQIARDATVIAVPYSDSRQSHLQTWCSRVIPRLEDGGGPFVVVIARQVGCRLPFNRGLVLVAAVLGVGPLDPAQRVVFWDVDLVPSADICAAIVDREPWGRHRVVNFSQPGFRRYDDSDHTFAGGTGHTASWWSWSADHDTGGAPIRRVPHRPHEAARTCNASRTRTNRIWAYAMTWRSGGHPNGARED